MSEAHGVDWSLPQPLLSLDGWASSSSEVPAFALEFVVHVGGPAREFFKSAARRSNYIWRISLNHWTGTQIRLQILRDEAARILTAWPMAQQIWLEDGTAENFATLFAGVKNLPPILDGADNRGSQIRRASLLQWVCAIDPELKRPDMAHSVAQYQNKLLDPHEFPLEALRFFSGYLRQIGQKAEAASFAKGWARAQAFLSVQDEESEEKSLSPGLLMANPTLQVVREFTTHGPQAQAIYRHRAELKTKSLSAEMGVLLEEVNESPRISNHDLLAAARADLHDISESVGASSDASLREPGAELEANLTELISAGVILQNL